MAPTARGTTRQIAIASMMPTARSVAGESSTWPSTVDATTTASATATAAGTTTVTGPEDQVETPWPFGLGAFVLANLVFHLFVLRGGVSVDPRLWG